MEFILSRNTKRNSVILTIKNIFYSGVSYFLRIPNIIFYFIFFCLLIVLEYSNFHLNPDTAQQLHTLKNFVNGHGISISSLDKYGTVIYKPCSLWPAGFVIFAAPIYFFTKSAIASILILKLISNIFFILFLSKYVNYLRFTENQKKFIILFLTISVAPFIEFYCSDMLATTVCMWSFYFYIKYQENEKVSYLLISIFLVALCYFIKYSFLPFLFYPMVAFVLKAKWNFLKKIKQFALITFFTVISGLLFYFLNKLLVGPAQMVSSMDAFNGDAHWTQLTRVKGFLFTFGLYPYNFQNLFADATGIFLPFNWISLAVTTYLYYLFIRYFLKKEKFINNKRYLNSLNISISAGALILGFLGFLTINNPGQTWIKPYWTFVEETRYYGPVIVIGLINILILFFIKNKGSLLHAIVLFMIVLNILAYRRTIRSGFYGNNLNSYLITAKDVKKAMIIDHPLLRSVVYFEKETENSFPYLYLQSEGIILLEKPAMELNKSKNFSNFILEKDSTGIFKISRFN
jgi:hypothetical protein